MSRIKLALSVVEDLRTLATSIETLANNVQGNDEPKVKESNKLTLEQVRAVLADKSQGGKQLEVKALITSFGATKLTDEDPVRYEELIKMAGEL